MCAFFLLVAGVMFWKGRVWWWIPGCVSGIFFLFAFIAPNALGPLEKVWMALAEKMSKVTTTIFLCLAFFLVITPMALLLKLLQKDILGLKLGVKSKDDRASDRAVSSYWVSLENRESSFRPWEPY